MVNINYFGNKKQGRTSFDDATPKKVN